MSYGERIPQPKTIPKTTEEIERESYLLFVGQHSRLPKSIVVKGHIYNRTAGYMHDVVDSYFIGYETASNFPNKKVYMFYEETNKYLAIMKAWRKLAEHADEVRK